MNTNTLQLTSESTPSSFTCFMPEKEGDSLVASARLLFSIGFCLREEEVAERLKGASLFTGCDEGLLMPIYISLDRKGFVSGQTVY